MSALALSVLLSFVSALAYAGGAIVQEQVAVSSSDSAYLPLRRPGWWGALALNGLGGVLHVVALACGPLSLVQPLGALTIVFALPMAALFVGRRSGATAWRGALMSTVGLAGLLSLVGSADAQSLSPAQRVAVALVTGGAVVALMFAGLAAHRHPAVRGVLLAVASGIAFGMSSVFTKTVAVDWAQGVGLAELPSLVVIGLFSAAGVLLSQASYRGAGLAAPLATLTVVNPVLAATVGILMFGETFRHGTTGSVLALACGVVAAGGLIMLTTERMEPAVGDPADGTATEAGTLAAGTATAALPSGERTVTGVPADKTATAALPSGGTATVGAARVVVPSGTGARTGVPAGQAASAAAAVAPDVAAVFLPSPRPREDVDTGAARTGLGETAGGPDLHGLLVPSQAGGTEPPAGGALPASSTALPVGVAVPLPVLDRQRAGVRS